MKIIPKLSNGGYSSYFSVWESSSTTSSRTSSSKKKSSEDDDFDDELKLKNKLMLEIVDTLKDVNLHTNEMSLISALANRIISSIAYNSPEEIALSRIKMLNKLNTFRNNKAEDDAALEVANKRGATNEVAIYKDLIAVLDANGNLDFVTLSEFDPSEYAPVTIGQLANMRDRNMSLANNIKIKLILQDGMSYNQFNAYIKDGLSNLGTDKVVLNGIYPWGSSDQSLAILALNDLQSKTPELRRAIINLLIEGKSTNIGLTELMNALISYIMSILPENAKTWAGFKLKTSDGDNAAKQLVLLYLASMGSSTKEINMDIDGFLSRNLDLAKDEIKAKEAADESDNKRPTSLAYEFLLGRGSKEMLRINTGSTSDYQVIANTMLLVDGTGNSLGTNKTMSEVALGLGYAAILDFSNVTMGGLRITSDAFNQLLVTDGKIRSIDYPSHLVNGNIIPNITSDVVSKKEKADKELRLLGVDTTNPESIKTNYNIVNQIYNKYLLDPLYDSDGVPTNWTRFAVMNGVAPEMILRNAEKGLLRVIDDDTRADNYDKIFASYDKSYDRDTWSITDWNGDLLFEGTIWIPIKKNYIGALGNKLVNVSQSNELEISALAGETANVLKKGPRL